MARREPFSSNKSGIRGNHQSRNGKTYLYLIILLVVIIGMIGFGRIAKGPSKGNNMDKNEFADPLSANSFSKEGELELFNSLDSLVVKIDIEIADDDAQTTKGLMYRRLMEENQGMLFIFPDIEIRSFWMKNTYIPLDLIFLDELRIIVHIHEGARPRSRASLPSIKPAKYVLEVNAGFSARHFLKAGDRMSFIRTY